MTLDVKQQDAANVVWAAEAAEVGCTGSRGAQRPECRRLAKPKCRDFSAVGTQNIGKHLFKEHGLIHKSGRRKPPALWKGKQEKSPSRNIVEMLSLDGSDPKE
ncbi:hypothetical protein NOF04DRAFT_1380202 [Fusarium oxysporum II5]|nr:hypothetical protein NOF04DRAFT_1380202 [Fusarium oxysporum II5]